MKTSSKMKEILRFFPQTVKNSKFKISMVSSTESQIAPEVPEITKKHDEHRQTKEVKKKIIKIVNKPSLRIKVDSPTSTSNQTS